MPTLYAGTTDSLQWAADVAQVSLDGGQTWRSAPTAGIASRYVPIALVKGYLADGSIVEMYADSSTAIAYGKPATVALFAWRVGDTSWRQVTPPITVTAWQFTVAYATPGSNGGPDRYWIVDTKGQPNVSTFAG